MISIQLSNLKLVLGARALFEGLNWEIQRDQKIGLIGPNGAGKSSLFKLITGEYTCEPGGSLTRARGISVGYLAQDPQLDPSQTASASALDGNPRVAEVESLLLACEDRLAAPEVWGDPQALAETLDQQQRLLQEWADLEGDTYSGRVRQILLGLGLPESDLEKPLSVLSGGQKKLVGLARLMVARHPVLLLDEPDNHLDLAGKTFLEEFIRGYPGAVVIISHDRYLLDAVVTHIAEIEDGRLTIFTGDYTSYVADKEERLARQQQLYQVQQHEIHRLEASIKRLSIWGKMYDNPKFISRAHSMQKRLDKMERIEQPVLERRRMGLELNGWRGSTKVLELREVCKSFGRENRLLEDLNLLVRHGERVGVIGPNGTGKSVLLRMILGTEAPDSGEILTGPSVKVGYYAQEHETLDFNSTLIDTVRRAAPMSESNAVSFLIRFLFPYRQATQRVGDLSGGERSRLQLALLVLSGANFLLLDEPTNNLDIASAEVLEAALEDFEGTVLVISHDRYFLDRVVDRVEAIEGGQLASYQGGYSDYLAQSQAVKERR